MSLLKNLQNITESERLNLQDLLLERILELEDKKEELLTILKPDHPKIQDIEELIKFNNYVYYWVENPTTEYLQ